MAAADYPAGLRTANRVSSTTNDDGIIVHIYGFPNGYGAKVWGRQGDTSWTIAMTKSGVVLRDMTGLPRMPHTNTVTNLNSILTAINETTEGSWTVDAALSTADRYLPSHVPSSVKHLYDPATNTYNVKASNMRRIRTQLGRAAAGLALARIAILGDSKSDSYNGSNAGNGGYDTTLSKWTWQFHKRLAAAAGIPIGGTGFVKIFHGGAYDPRWTAFSGSWTMDITGPYVYSIAANNTATFSTVGTAQSGTTLDIWYMDYGATPWTVAVDGATSGAGFVTVTPTGTNLPKKVTITGLADTPHTAVIKNTGGGVLFLYGAELRRAAGVVVDSYALNGGWAALYGPASPMGTLYRVHDPEPDLLVMFVGPNDIGTHPGAQNKTVAVALQDAADTLALYPNSDIIIGVEDQPAEAFIPTAKWAQYVAGLYALADTLDVPIVDMMDRWGSWSDPRHLIIMIDGVHQDPAGDADWACAMTGAVNPQ